MNEPVDLGERIRHELHQSEVNEAVRRTQQLIFTMRSETYRIYENLFPSEVGMINHQEITAAFAYLAGRIMAERCPEKDLPTGAGILWDWVRKGVGDGLGVNERPLEDKEDGAEV